MGWFVGSERRKSRCCIGMVEIKIRNERKGLLMPEVPVAKGATVVVPVAAVDGCSDK